MNHIGTITLDTDRLILRRFTIEDNIEMYNNWTSDDEVTKYLTWKTHKSVEDAICYIKYCLDGYEESSFYQWGIELKENHELIGNISVVKVIDDIDSLELGWVISRDYWGNGYTAEAASKLLQILFEKVGANSIYATHDINNPNSGRVMEKIGMKYEGTLRQSARNKQGIVDSARYSILKCDYENSEFYSEK